MRHENRIQETRFRNRSNGWKVIGDRLGEKQPLSQEDLSQCNENDLRYWGEKLDYAIRTIEKAMK